jgi:hypothetical protein
MKRTLLSFSMLFSLASGCAAIDGNFVGGSSGGTTPAQSSSKEHVYDVMESQPPPAQKESVPSLSANEVWVPGYYQPVAGNWLWHQGQVQPVKAGYKLVPASYREEGGKVYFSPPKWRRADLAEKK